MTSGLQPTANWAGWLKRWDAQQEGYVPDREARFTVMLDALAELLPSAFVALDLACGPGAISQRLLARFREAQAIALDLDPVMLAIGRGALGTFEGRLRWIESDLASPDWPAALGETRIDAVLSSTALHWLEPESLRRLYHDLARLLPPGGIFLNADHMAYPAQLPTHSRLSLSAIDERWTDSAFAERGIETAEQWWDALADEPAFDELLRARAARLAGKRRQATPPGFAEHVAALDEAGFREIGTVWQFHSDRVLLAVR